METANHPGHIAQETTPKEPAKGVTVNRFKNMNRFQIEACAISFGMIAGLVIAAILVIAS